MDRHMFFPILFCTLIVNGCSRLDKSSPFYVYKPHFMADSMLPYESDEGMVDTNRVLDYPQYQALEDTNRIQPSTFVKENEESRQDIRKRIDIDSNRRSQQFGNFDKKEHPVLSKLLNPFRHNPQSISSPELKSMFQHSLAKDISKKKWHEHYIEKYKSEYLSVPSIAIKVMNSLEYGRDVCQDLEVPLFKSEVKLRNETIQKLKPSWMFNTNVYHHKIGACPYVLTKRYLSRSTVPSEVLELQCFCEYQTCSSLGDFQCVPVNSTITTRVWDNVSMSFQVDTVELTVACVCAQKTSRYGNNINYNNF